MIKLRLSRLLVLILLCNCNPSGKEEDKIQIDSSQVMIASAMRNVMWNGELEGQIYFDTIQNKKGLNGIGPLEYLAGEIMIIDGKCFISSVTEDTTIQVRESFDARAPFFVYSNVSEWKEEKLPDSILTIPQLEDYLDRKTTNSTRPFTFKISGIVEEASIHIQNLPKGTSVSNPQEAHQGQFNMTLKEVEVEIIGFFSTEHAGVFTHHDTYLHMHLLTKDKNVMGHLDELKFSKGTKLFLPSE